MIITSIAKNKRHSIGNRQTSQKQESFCEMLDVVCHICASSFDSVEHIPMSLCPEEHTYCNKCLSDLFAHHSKGTRCPTCRVFITQTGVKVNKTLLRLSELVPRASMKYNSLEEEKKLFEKKLIKLQLEVQSREEEQSDRNKQNHNENGDKKDQFNGFPLISPNELISKSKKVNIHSYMSRRRRISSAASKKDDEIKIDQMVLKKKLV